MAKNNSKSIQIRYLRAIEAFEGGRAELAQKLGISKPAIDSWVANNKISANYALPLSKLFEGRVSLTDLLGDCCE